MMPITPTIQLSPSFETAKNTIANKNMVATSFQTQSWVDIHYKRLAPFALFYFGK